MPFCRQGTSNDELMKLSVGCTHNMPAAQRHHNCRCTGIDFNLYLWKFPTTSDTPLPLVRNLEQKFMMKTVSGVDYRLLAQSER